MYNGTKTMKNGIKAVKVVLFDRRQHMQDSF